MSIESGGVPVSADLESKVFVSVTIAGLPGAPAACRLAGATVSGSPVSGGFAAGDVVVDLSGNIWLCTVAGSPGTWTGLAGGGSFLPRPSGTASAGEIPVATGAGNSTVWAMGGMYL